MRRYLYLFAILIVVGIATLFLAFGGPADSPEDTNPINALMITGGGWHDYEAQKHILADGISERINVEFTIDHSAGEDVHGDIARHRNTDWAEEFDLVLYNMCFTEMRDPEWSQRIVDAHVEHNIPAVVLHCALHSYTYHGDDDTWLQFSGVRTYRHQSHMPYTVEVLDVEHPIMRNFPDEWRTPRGELYNIEEVFETATPLAHAYGEDTDEYQVNIWVNEYEGVRVFGTTIGHHNETMEHENYLNLVSNGLLWAADQLDDQGHPRAGYSSPPAGE